MTVLSPFRSLATQINDLSGRLDSMEASIKKDVQTILSILHHNRYPSDGKMSDDSNQAAKPFNVDAPYQPSDGNFQFDPFGVDGKRPRPGTASANVHRSISQPECTQTDNEKSLLRY